MKIRDKNSSTYTKGSKRKKEGDTEDMTSSSSEVSESSESEYHSSERDASTRSQLNRNAKIDFE